MTGESAPNETARGLLTKLADLVEHYLKMGRRGVCPCGDCDDARRELLDRARAFLARRGGSAGPDADAVAEEVQGPGAPRCGECGGESPGGEPVCDVCHEAADGRRRLDGRLVCLRCLAEEEAEENARQVPR